MTAAEARKIATDVNHNGVNDQLAIITQMIKEAVGKGQFKVWIYNIPIKPEVSMRLEVDGYKIHPTEADRNETATKITW